MKLYTIDLFPLFTELVEFSLTHYYAQPSKNKDLLNGAHIKKDPINPYSKFGPDWGIVIIVEKIQGM